MKYYILFRAPNDYMIISCTEGSNPLYGFGSWDQYGGPYSTWEEANAALPEEIKTH